MSLSKNIVRYGVLTALVAGTATVVVGPDTMGALLRQTRDDVRDVAAKQVRDPVALRAQIRSLAEEYPKRIADVRGDLAELREQVRQLEREKEVSERVVSLAAADLEQMGDMLSRAEVAQAENPGHVVRVVLANESVELEDAYAKASRVRQVQDAYANRHAEIERDLGYLAQQEQRLVALADQLESENAAFQAQMWQLDRQIDSIQRNERLITMMEKRQRTLEDNSSTRAHSLDQIAARFADVRAKQEARLEALSTTGAVTSYEDRAKVQIDAERGLGLRQGGSGAGGSAGAEAGATGAIGPARFVGPRATRGVRVSPPVIEIGPGGGGVDRPVALPPVAEPERAAPSAEGATDTSASRAGAPAATVASR
jgi:predicted RNase H-like nuclease (RuvC/YqgF family)